MSESVISKLPSLICSRHSVSRRRFRSLAPTVPHIDIVLLRVQSEWNVIFHRFWLRRWRFSKHSVNCSRHAEGTSHLIIFRASLLKSSLFLRGEIGNVDNQPFECLRHHERRRPGKAADQGAAHFAVGLWICQEGSHKGRGQCWRLLQATAYTLVLACKSIGIDA